MEAFAPKTEKQKTKTAKNNLVVFMCHSIQVKSSQIVREEQNTGQATSNNDP